MRVCAGSRTISPAISMSPFAPRGQPSNFIERALLPLEYRASHATGVGALYIIAVGARRAHDKHRTRLSLVWLARCLHRASAELQRRYTGGYGGHGSSVGVARASMAHGER